MGVPPALHVHRKEAAVSDLPFTQLGPYEIRKLIGRGGMGAVYLGVHRETAAKAAVKVLSPTLADDRNFQARFAGEIESLQALRHENIVQLYGFGQEADRLFYAMEYVPGLSLQQELKAGRRFDWREVTRIGIDICKALKHAHDVGVIHRDLKPGNLLFGLEERVKLTDFGIAKFFGGSQHTSLGDVIGTADYMSPEQAEGQPVTPRSDLFALGSVLYALLTGKPPFYAKALPEVLHHLRFDDPAPLRRRHPEAPEEMEEIVSRLLAKDPLKRIPTARAAWRRLEGMLESLSVVERPSDRASVPDSLDAEHVEAPPQNGEGEKEIAPSRQGGQPVSVASRETAPASRAGAGDVADPNPDLLAPALTPPPSTPSPGPPNGNDGGSDHSRSDHSRSDHFHSDPEAQTGVWSGEGPSVAASSESAERRRFVTVAEAQSQARVQRFRERGVDVSGWLMIAGLAAAIAAFSGFVWYLMQPPPPDELYERVMETSVGELDDLVEAEQGARQFLEHYGSDPRAEEIRGLLEEIELAHLERRYERRARLRTGAGGMSLVERDYIDALRLANHEPETAATRLRAMIDVYSAPDMDGETKVVLELSRRRLKRLTQRQEPQIKKARERIAKRLAFAETIAPADPERAEEIYRGVILLYGKRPWAKDLAQQARDALIEPGVR